MADIESIWPDDDELEEELEIQKQAEWWREYSDIYAFESEADQTLIEKVLNQLPENWKEHDDIATLLLSIPDGARILKRLGELHEKRAKLSAENQRSLEEHDARVMENIRCATADFALLKNVLPDGLEAYAEISKWADNHEALLTDFNILKTVFNKSVVYHWEIGTYFRKEQQNNSTWFFISSKFIKSLRAFVCLHKVPLNADRLARVIEIRNTYDSDHETETKNSSTGGTTWSWRPRYTFREQQRLAEEALKILAEETNVLELWLKHSSSPKRHPKSPDEKQPKRQSTKATKKEILNAAHAVLENGQTPSKERVKLHLKDSGKTIGNDELHKVLSQWRIDRKKSGPQ